MVDAELKKAVETLLFITDKPLSIERIRDLVGSKETEPVAEAVAEIRRELESRSSSLQLLEIAGGFQMATQSPYAPFVRKLFADRLTMRLSNAAHETLSIIAYKQPLTRAEIEEIRGVEVIAALETLLEKRLIRVAGRKETVGRPLLYGTTQDFLRQFGLKSLEDLPPIESFAAQAAGALPEGPQGGPSAETASDHPAEPTRTEEAVAQSAQTGEPAEAGDKTSDLQ